MWIFAEFAWNRIHNETSCFVDFVGREYPVKLHYFLSLVTLGGLTLSLLGFYSGQPSDLYRKVRIEGLNITVTLEKHSDRVEQTAWPAQSTILIAQSVPVAGKTINELLLERHISPDVEAFTVVYALNPEIQKLRQLEVAHIRIPVLADSSMLESIFAKGFEVFVTVEKERKKQFSDKVQILKKLIQEVSKFGPERFEGASDREPVISSLNTTATLIVKINERLVQRFGRPITTDGLAQLTGDVRLLDEVLSARTTPGAKILSSDKHKILAIENDVRLKSRAFSEVAAPGDPPDRAPEVVVIVKTLNAKGQVPNLRIYYVPKLLKGQDDEVNSFGVLSSPTMQRLPEADYCFWGARDPTKKRVTSEQCLEIRIDRPSEVQLTVVS